VVDKSNIEASLKPAPPNLITFPLKLERASITEPLISPLCHRCELNQYTANLYTEGCVTHRHRHAHMHTRTIRTMRHHL